MTNTTPVLRLNRPNFNQSTWHDEVNGNFAKLDAWAASLGIAGVDADWDNDTTYVIGDRIFDVEDEVIFECVVGHTSAISGTFAADRTANPTYWVAVNVGLVPRGQWVTLTRYRAGDIVFEDGSSYYATEDHISGTFATDLSNGLLGPFANEGAPGAGTGDVVGPAGATDSQVVLFDGITGKIIKSAGVLFSALAQLVSPAFTGNPTAPTQPAGNNSTRLATTAFVVDAITTAVTAGVSSAITTAVDTIRAGVTTAFDTLLEVEAAFARTAFLDVEDQIVTGGGRITPKSLGTITTGTVTPDPGDRGLQYLTNNGAFTLAPSSSKGTIVLEITNAASAGAITTSSFTKVVGAFTTTNGHKFIATIVIHQTYSLLSIQSLQA